MLAWPPGHRGWRTIDKVGREAAVAPGVAALKQMFIDLLPECEEWHPGRSNRWIRCAMASRGCSNTPKWWIPGLILVGDSAHFFGPETGASSGIGLGDAQALARRSSAPGRSGRRMPEL